jgi:hypothetical protein
VRTGARSRSELKIQRVDAEVCAMKLKHLPPGSPEAKRRDELLAIMRDETKSEDERYMATLAALPLSHEEVPPIVVYTNRPSAGRVTTKRSTITRGKRRN